MEAIRHKITTYREENEKLRDELADLNAKHKDECNRKEALETEVANLSRSLQLVDENLEDVETRLNDASKKLGETSTHRDELELKLRRYEGTTDIDKNKIDELSQNVSRINLERDEVERNYDELKRKVTCMEADVDKLEERNSVLSNENTKLKDADRISSATLTSVEAHNTQLLEREDKLEDQLARITTKYDEVERNYETTSKEASRLRILTDSLENAIDEEKAAKLTLQEELEGIRRELTDM